MTRLRRWGGWALDHPLALFLFVQAALLCYRPGLLPVWCDEHFTLYASRLAPERILSILARDIHPPFYYFLVHYWLLLPLPVSPIEAARLLSALITLAATVAVDRCWLRRLDRETRFWFLLLWTLSPLVLLYGRMARSYSLQVLAACLALRFATDLAGNPRDRRALWLYAAAAAFLLYVHYLPGVAVMAAAALVFWWKLVRRCDMAYAVAAILPPAAVALIYLPWLSNLADGVGRVSQASPYSLTGHASLETGVKLTYTFVAFAFGESPPWWVMAAGVAAAPPVLLLLGAGIGRRPAWLPVVLTAAAVGYVGAARWVTFPFVPARLLWLFPFFLLLLLHGRQRRPRLAAVVLPAILLVSLGSLRSYYRMEDFLNKGYVAPRADLAWFINARSSGGRALLLLDAYSTDALDTVSNLREGITVVHVRGPKSVASILESIDSRKSAVVWYLRNTRDLSPGGLNRKLEAELLRRFPARRYLFVPYSPVDRAAMRLLRWPERPTHLLQLLELRPRD